MSAKRLNPFYPRAIAVTTKFPVDVVETIETLAAANKQSRSDYVRQIVLSHLKTGKTA